MSVIQIFSPLSDWSWWWRPLCLFHSHTVRYHPHRRRKHPVGSPPWWWPFLSALCKPAGVCSVRSPRGPTEQSPPAPWCSHSRQTVLGSLQAKSNNEIQVCMCQQPMQGGLITFDEELPLCPTWFHVVRDGVVGANVESGETSELP